MKRIVRRVIEKMDRIKNIIQGFLILTLILCFIPNNVLAEERDDGYFTIKDKKTGEIIFQTSRYVYIGDEYLNENNKLYRVISIDGDEGLAEFVEEVDLTDFLPSSTEQKDFPVTAEQSKRISVYHTHGDESYVPTDGAASIKNGGGILSVGEIFAKNLEEKGVEVLHSTRVHFPHDNAAYQRSRRTARELLQQGVDAQFDIHRDAIPPERYITDINGEKVARVRLVVGKQNPNYIANDNFAKQLKAAGDQIYPGLIKGIFYARGTYNQDLAPRSILVEVGTDKNDRQIAEKGAALFADVAARTLYGEDLKETPGPAGTTSPIKGETSAIGKTLLWLIVLTVIGIGGYMLITGGSWEEIKTKLSKFSTKEFANFLKKKKNRD
jgi:stage II sporulation protein P